MSWNQNSLGVLRSLPKLKSQAIECVTITDTSLCGYKTLNKQKDEWKTEEEIEEIKEQ